MCWCIYFLISLCCVVMVFVVLCLFSELMGSQKRRDVRAKQRKEEEKIVFKTDGTGNNEENVHHEEHNEGTGGGSVKVGHKKGCSSFEMLAICSLTRSFQSTRFLVPAVRTEIKTPPTTDIAANRLNWPRSRCSENYYLRKRLLAPRVGVYKRILAPSL